jgi:hypothetical protein
MAARSLVGKEEARIHVGRLHGLNQAVHSVTDLADFPGGHRLEGVQQSTLRRLRRVGDERRPAPRELHVDEAVIELPPEAPDESALLEAVDEERHAALVHGERGGQPTGRHAAIALQRLQRPELRPRQAVGLVNVLRVRVQGLHDPTQALNDLYRVDAPFPPPGRGCAPWAWRQANRSVEPPAIYWCLY